LRADSTWSVAERQSSLVAGDGDGGSRALSVQVAREGEPAENADAPRDALLHGEWPWRLRALPFDAGYAQRTTLVHPGRWGDSPLEGEYVAEEVAVVVRGAEPIWTPAGRYIAWRVTVGDKYTAWYDVEYPHTPLSYNDGEVTWLLVD